MSVPHDDDVSGVVYRCLPQSVSATGTRDPAMGVHVVLGHAQWTIAEEIRRNRLAGIWGDGVWRGGRREEAFKYNTYEAEADVYS